MIRLTVPEIAQEDIRAVDEVLASGFLVQGRKVGEFEEALAGYVGDGEVVAVGSGTAALHLALLASGIGAGDEVLVSDFTFPATANAVIHCGAVPVLVDVERGTLNMDPEAARACVTPRARAILPVHAFGRPVVMDAIGKVARENGLAIIEDAACALGSHVNGAKCGTLGSAGCFSFHPRKSITTGEGGAIASSDRDLCRRVRSLRSHGADPTASGRLQFTSAGFNYRMTEIGAVLGLGQLGRLDEIIARKEEIVKQYRARLGGVEGVLMLPSFEHGRDCHQSLVVSVGDDVERDGLIERMRDLGVETTIGTYALHREPLFRREYGYREGQLPVSDWAFRKTLSLPLYPAMTTGDVAKVCDALSEAVRARG
ncbi:MAG: DegT/DnrJ/EryC1/StrS aminotransferase family protein [Candidatus Eisenbacteria sp.]|nr:DegT/DnrJ/EryC1/StrS aminotransferase family protein [Candidatus Eisenbacteria bacterium]